MGTQRIAVPYMTHTDASLPTRNFQTAPAAPVSGGGSKYGGTLHQVWLTWPLSVPAGAVVTKATLHLFTAKAVPAVTARTFTVRRVTGGWNIGALTYSNRPVAVNTQTSTVSQPASLAAGSGFVFDIKALVQYMVDNPGEKWLGVSITAGANDATTWFHTEQSSTVNARPYVVIEWSDAPKTPTRLSPSGSRVVSTPYPALRCIYSDVSGDTSLAAMQVQYFGTEAAARAGASPKWDSGPVAVTVPEMYPQDVGAPALPTSGDPTWWRCRVQDGAGLWSPWSSPAGMFYRPLPTVKFDTLVDGGTIGDLTPTVSWTVTSGAQVSREMHVYDGRGAPRVRGTWTAVQTTAQSATLPTGAIVSTDDTVTIELLVRDGYTREEIPNGPAAARVAATVHYKDDPSLDKPLTVTATQGTSTPGMEGPAVEIVWTTKYQPDAFTLTRNNEVVFNVSSTDLRIEDLGGGKYRYIDRHVPAHHPMTYSVRSVVNGKASQPTSATVTMDAVGIWLVDPRGELKPVLVADVDSGSWSMAEESSFHYALDSTKPVLITASQGGYRGTVSGLLVSDAYGPGIRGGISASEWRDRLVEYRKRPGRTWCLVLQDMDIDVLIRDVTIRPLPDEDLMFDVSFEFAQITREFW